LLIISKSVQSWPAAKGRKRTDDNGTVGCNLWAWPCQAALHTPATKSPYRSSVDADHAGIGPICRRNCFETLQISAKGNRSAISSTEGAPIIWRRLRL